MTAAVVAAWAAAFAAFIGPLFGVHIANRNARKQLAENALKDLGRLAFEFADAISAARYALMLERGASSVLNDLENERNSLPSIVRQPPGLDDSIRKMEYQASYWEDRGHTAHDIMQSRDSALNLARLELRFYFDESRSAVKDVSGKVDALLNLRGYAETTDGDYTRESAIVLRSLHEAIGRLSRCSCAIRDLGL